MDFSSNIVSSLKCLCDTFSNTQYSAIIQFVFNTFDNHLSGNDFHQELLKELLKGYSKFIGHFKKVTNEK